MYDVLCGIVIALAGGVAVSTILNTIGERWSRPAHRVEVFHNDRPEWYPGEGE